MSTERFEPSLDTPPTGRWNGWIKWVNRGAQGLTALTALVTLSMALSSPGHDAPGQRLRNAMQTYQSGQWPQAFTALAELADDGNPNAARIAEMMVRQGPRLFGRRFEASAEQIMHWRYLTGEVPAGKSTF